jgi:hypothetical protein
VVLGCFLLYGPAEAMLNFSRESAAAWVPYVAFSAALFLLWGWGLLRMGATRAPSRRLLSAGIPFALALPLYFWTVVLVKVQANPVFLTLPNPAPGILAVGPEFKLVTYHVAIFGLFFPLLYGALALPLFRGVEMGARERLLRLFVAWLGWGSLGLTYQDWFYFVAHPTEDLVPGGRYGVYFDHWLGPLPTVYLLAHLWALGMLRLAWRGTRTAPRLGRAWAVVGLFAVTGAALTLVKPLWAG